LLPLLAHTVVPLLLLPRDRIPLYRVCCTPITTTPDAIADAASRPPRCRFGCAQPTLRAQPPPLQPRICVAPSQQHLLRLCRHRRNDCSGRRNDYSGRHHDLDS
jgi:hypothetical protein